MIRQHIFLCLAVSSTVYAALRGGAPERIVAALFIAGMVLSPLVQLPRQSAFQSAELGIFAIDLMILIALVLLAMTSTRYWTMAMASLAMPPPLATVVAVLQPGMLPRGYFVIEVMPSWLMMILLLIATRRHRIRLRRYGMDPAWQHELSAEYRQGASAERIR